MKPAKILYGGLQTNKNDNKPCSEEAWADLKAKAVKRIERQTFVRC